METKDKKRIIKIIYFYLFSLIGLSLIVIGSVSLVNLTLKTLIFKQADEIIVYPYRPEINLDKKIDYEKDKIIREELEYQKRQQTSNRQKTAANALSMILIGIPLYLYHWKTIQRNEEKEN